MDQLTEDSGHQKVVDWLISRYPDFSRWPADDKEWPVVAHWGGEVTEPTESDETEWLPWDEPPPPPPPAKPRIKIVGRWVQPKPPTRIKIVGRWAKANNPPIQESEDVGPPAKPKPPIRIKIVGAWAPENRCRNPPPAPRSRSPPAPKRVKRRRGKAEPGSGENGPPAKK